MSDAAPAPSPSAEAQPVSASTQTSPDRRTRVALLLAWLVFLLSTAIPSWFSVIASTIVMVWLLAVQTMLHTGSLSGSDTLFAGGVFVGLALAGLSLLGAALRRLGSPRLEMEKRQRIIGPGGRVLNIIYQRGHAVTTKPLLSWLPDLPLLLVALIVIVCLQAWGSSRPLPSALSLALIIANLYLLLIYLPMWLARFGWRFLRGVYRFAGRSSFRAGMFTILFLLPMLAELFGVVIEYPAKRLLQASRSDAGQDEQYFSQIEKAQSLLDFHRRAFIETADAWWPDRAFDAEIRHFLLPLFDAASSPYEAQGTGISLVPSKDWRDLLDWPQARAAWAQDGQDIFADCLHTLYPRNVRKAARIVRRDYRLSDDDSDDIALGALLSICENHGTHNYPNLVAAYFLTVGRNAKKRVDPNRKYRREVISSALGSMFTDCGEPADFVESCPSPWASPEEQAASWEEISLVKRCQLSRLQRTVIVQKALLEMSDEEISSHHAEMRPIDAKNTYQNARRKVREELASACPHRRW